MLREVERLYGPRDPTWTMLGIYFSPDGPQTWYPSGGGKNIVIQLGMYALHNTGYACFQLAHECVHLLAPAGGGGPAAPVIEEGLATVFAEDYVAKHGFPITGFTRTPAYIDAAAKVRQLLSISPEAIRLLRGKEPSFKEMTDETFSQAGLNVPAELGAELLAAVRSRSR